MSDTEWVDDSERSLVQQVAVVREIYGDEPADLVANGWTVDAALAHYDGACDVTICTHPSHRTES